MKTIRIAVLAALVVAGVATTGDQSGKCPSRITAYSADLSEVVGYLYEYHGKKR